MGEIRVENRGEIKVEKYTEPGYAKTTGNKEKTNRIVRPRVEDLSVTESNSSSSTSSFDNKQSVDVVFNVNISQNVANSDKDNVSVENGVSAEYVNGNPTSFFAPKENSGGGLFTSVENYGGTSDYQPQTNSIFKSYA